MNIEIKIGSQKRKQVQDFVYLWGSMSEDAASDQDIIRKTAWTGLRRYEKSKSDMESERDLTRYKEKGL